MGFGEVSPGARACQVGVVDEVLDVLVEHESRNSAGPAHEMFDTQVQVARLQGFEVRVAEGRLVIVNDKTRGQLPEGRSTYGLSPGRAHLSVLVQLITPGQARQPVRK